MAVDPEFQKKGIGRKLVFALIGEKNIEINKLEMVTRRANTPALDFYRNLGFKESSFQHEGLDPKVYTGFEWQLTDLLTRS